MLIPKRDDILSFFPKLNKERKNPRCLITFVDSFGDKWSFSFVYYNNTFFGGTRNEYRLTGMTGFMRSHNLKAGDEIVLKRDRNGFYRISYSRKKAACSVADGKLKLGTSWKVVKI